MDKGCIQELFESAVGVILGEEMVNTWLEYFPAYHL